MSYLLFMIPVIVILIFLYTSKMNRRKLSNKGLVTPDGFWKTFFKVIGVMASIIGYVVFLHERDEKIKEIVQNDVHSKIYGNSANKSNSDDYLSPTHQDARQAILVSSKSNSNNTAVKIKELVTLAEQGDVNAQSNLGEIYYKGDGVVQDYTQAAKWLQKAAEQGNARAQNILGVMYLYGRYFTKDNTQAVKWFQKAAEQGEARAQNALGVLHQNGIGVTKDYKKSVAWYLKAAEQGNANAQVNLGFLYYQGIGVVQDYSQTVYWYRKAAEQGLEIAQAGLAFMYTNEIGVSKNLLLAYMLYNLAAVNGSEQYASDRNALAARLTSAQLVEAQALAAQWKVGTPLPTTTKN